jgi:hypothetical protein
MTNVVQLTAGAIVDDPALIPDVPSADVPALLAQLTACAAALAVRMPTAESSRAPASPDRLMKPDEAASVLNVSVDFLRRSPSLKTVRVYLDRELRVSEAALQALIARRRGRE